MGRGDRGACALGVVVALASSLWLSLGSEAFSLDDAYIHLAYAKSLWLGEGLSYNPHDWELGATSPLWALLLAPLSTLAQVETAVRVLGALLHAGGAHVTGVLAGRLGAPLRWPAVAMFALHPVLLQASTSGMEVSLTTALLLLLCVTALEGRYRTASALGFAAVLARPEALVFALALALAALRRDRRALAIGLGALLAMAGWCTYCLLISGYPLPNTFYAKAGFEPQQALAFVALRVLGEEPWLLGLGAAWLITMRRDRGAWQELAVAYLVTLLAVAGGRSLRVELLFSQQRYFACFAFVPIALACAAAGAGRWRSPWLLAPSLLASLLCLPRAVERTHAQERNTRVLHVDVAAFVNEALPRDARIAVEGAGALRFFTARSLTVIDVLGLNDRQIMHAGSSVQRLCASATRLPSYLALPDALVPAFSALYDGELLRTFHVERFAHVIEPYPWTVQVVRVRGLRAEMVARCRAAQNDAR